MGNIIGVGGNGYGYPASADQRNIISDNGDTGVNISTGASGNLVAGNLIGTDGSGTQPLGNQVADVLIDNAPNNLIGSTLGDSSGIQQNVIAGSPGSGVEISGSTATGNFVADNLIGLNVDSSGNPISGLGNGSAIPGLGNVEAGIYINDPADPNQDSTGNTIGGTAAGAGNIIANNYGPGVAVTGPDAFNEPILGNAIYSNSGLGIDLGDDGVTPITPGGPHAGPNDLQGFPALTSATSDATGTTIQGSFNSTPNTTFALQFFANDAPDPTGFGQGQQFLGSLSISTDGNGNASFTETFATSVPSGQFIAETATDPNGNTSEFSLSVGVNTAQVNVTVNPSTVSTDLQNVVRTLQSAATGTTSPVPSINLAVDPTTLNSVNSAIDALAANPSASTNPVLIVLNLASGTYSDTVISVPAGVQVTIDGGNGNVNVVGNSPAFVVNAGTVLVENLTFTTATNSSTIVVNCGSLILRDCTIQSSTGYDQAAILINGGMVDLGTASSPGGNTLNLNGNGGFLQDSTSVPVSGRGDTLEVNGAPLAATDLSLTTLDSSTSSTTYGQSVTLTADVQAANPTDGTPTGGVDFVDATTGADLGTAPLSVGVAQLTTTALVAGTDEITARYLGHSTFAFSLATLTETVAPVALTITANNQAKVYGQANPSLTVSYSGFVNGDNAASLTTPPTVTTTATTLSSVGSYPITAAGAADANYTISYVAGTMTINQDGSTVIASATGGPFGQAVTLNATVTANAPGSGTPTGSVDFFDTTTSDDLGSVTLSGGHASLTTTVLSPGSHSIEVTYSGDGNFSSSSASVGTIAIKPSIVVLDPSAGGALSLSGNARIYIGGGVYVDSSSSSAVSASGNGSVTASAIDVHGGVHKSGNASFNPTPVTGAAIVPDPLASLSQPSTTGLTNQGSVSLGGNSSETIQQGIYSRISVSGNARLIMDGGTYIIEGGGFSISGNASVSGSGVLIVNAGSQYPNSGGSYAGIAMSGNGSYNLTPLATGTYAGIIIFQSRDDIKAMTVSGNATGMTGTIYAPAAQLTESGNAQLNAALIVDRLTISGNGIANIMTLDSPSGTVASSLAQVRDAYGINALAQDGSGQTIAIADDFDDPANYPEALSVLLAAVPGPALAKTGSSAPAAMTPLDRVSAHDAVLGNWAPTRGAAKKTAPGSAVAGPVFRVRIPVPASPRVLVLQALTVDSALNEL